ncbi:MAG: VWA domain-containing protein [Planctomycetes bacterium]|nr:VWA domain-containing protein [Planctomycetota bacterium]
MFAHPLALFALLAVPAVLALHLYRRRFERQEVSALFLWQSAEHAAVAGRQREPLRASLSFWCELLAAALLALACAAPRAACVASPSEHLVVVLDSSASMGARAEGASARERAVAHVRGLVDALPSGSRVTLVRSGPRPSLLAGPAAFPAEARAALEDWQPLCAHHDLGPAVGLALQFALDARVVLVSDHFEPERWPAEIELASVGRPLDNWAVTHASRARERDESGVEHERLFLTLSSFAAQARTLSLRVLAGAQELAQERRELAPLARAHFAFRLAEGCGPVEVRIDGDALTLDNAVLLAPVPARTLGLCATLDEAELVALGLSASGPRNIARWLALVPHSVEAASPAAAHLLLAHAPLAGPANWTIVLEPLGTERSDLIGPFLADRAHALLDGTTLEGSVWSVDPQLTLAGTPLVSAGNQALLTEERLGERRHWRLALDPTRSSLQRSPDWPILLANMAELRRAALPGPERTNLTVGEPFVYRPGTELTGVERTEAVSYTLSGPLDSAEASTRAVPALEQVRVDDLERPGLYRLSFADTSVAEFAVAFADAAESDLRQATRGTRASSREAARVESELSWVELALILGALALALLDWFALARLAAWSRID